MFWRALRAGGALALRSRCVFFCWRALRAGRLCCVGAAFFFLARVACGRCGCAALGVRFFSGVRRWRTVRVRCSGGAFFFWRAPRAARVRCFGAAFFFLARVAGGGCACAASAACFFFWRASLAAGARVLRRRCVFLGRASRAARVGCRGVVFFGARRWRCWRPAPALRFFSGAGVSCGARSLFRRLFFFLRLARSGVF